MANVKVAVRVRPLTSKESADGGRLAVQVEDKYVRVRNVKLDGRTDGAVDSREKLLEFGFDYCYWSVDPQDPQYTSQEEVFQDLGVSVLAGASEGYNVCLFAYGQTGSGKTYTMMGSRDSVGLTPRICEGLFSSVDSFPDRQNSSRVEISFLEIYNERVRDLLRLGEQKKRQNLRVREHPEKGPYVQDLSQHVVTDYKQALDLLEEGVANRITAATHNHEASSRSHAIFTIQYTQAILENNLPSEIVSKINLVDLAGSERADPHYCRDRLTEGSSINKSLVTLGIVISALAQNSQMSSSCQSINSMASEGEASLGGSVSISHSGGGGGGGASGGRRHCFIPYRDSVLTWLLKDSLGGNSKTIMIATVSPSGSSYNETLSTLRYAAHARNIVNKPRVNEDASVRLIRELRQEVDRLKSMLLSFQMQRNLSPSLSEERDGTLSDMVLQNELKVEQLTQDWSEGWRGEKQALLEQYGVDIDGDRAGVLVRSLQPHLVSLDRDVLSTGVLLHHLREGVTLIGPHRSDRPEERQIVVQGDGSCEIVNEGGVVTLRPMAGSVCVLNDREVTEPCRLAQGSVITLGSAHRFRFNHPAEAAVLRERRRAIGASGFRELCQIPSASSAGGGKPQSGSEAALSPSEESAARQQVEEQQWYVETLRREIQSEQRTAERELEREQAHLQQQQADVQQWILQEKQRLLSVAPKGTQESGVQADLLPAPHLERFSSSPPGSEDSTAAAASVPDPPPPRLVRARKKAVQDELLRILALRRAERRVRRKRLHLQLERIARKRHLLEAKRELQRLEQTLPPGLESPGSPEPGSPYGSRGQPSLNPRRHSFSVETLSRLYPQHPPIYSHYLKRNRSTERTLTPPRTGDCFSRRWLSDECLPRERSRSCSSSRVSSGPSLAPGGRAGSSENLKETVKEPPPTQSYQERPERKPLLTNRSLTFKNSQNPRGSLKSPQRTALQPISNEKVKDTPVENPKVQKIAYGDFRTAQESQGVGTIGKVFFRSVGPGLKTALTKVFRKPPAGMNGRRNSLQVNRTNRLHWRNISQDGGLEDGRTERHQCALKMTVSCEELDQRTAPADLTHRHWHSTEALMDQTSSWVEQLQPGLAGWTEDEGGGGRDEGSSDCDSLLSVDSLSSAYAAVLAERLRREEALGSESDSADSQMSKDSLAADGSALRSGPTRSLAPTYARVTRLLAGQFRTPAVCTVLEQTNGQSTQGTPAEACRGQNGGSHVIAGRRTEIVVKPPVHKTQDEPVTKQIIFPGSPGSPSSCSTREPDLQLALTDAWSSTDAADSPSVSRECSRTFREKTLFRAGNMNSSSSSSPSLISVDLSDCQGRSRSCISTTCSSAEGVHVTVGNQNVKASTALSDTLFSDTETPPEPGFVTTVMVGTGVDNDGRGPTRQHKILESVQKITADVQTNSHLGVEPLTETSKSLSSADIEICHSNLTRHQPIKVHQLFTGVSPMESPGVINSFETVLCTSSQPLESCVKTQSAVHEIYTEDNELLSLDETEKLNNVKPYKNTDAKEFSTPRNQTPLMFEAQRSEPALPEHELVHPACKSSRKRNKELTETVAGGLKIPKRSVEVTPETFRARQIAGREVCWPDGNGDNMDAEEKVPNVNEDILYPDLDHANMDARTESQPRGWKRDQAEENVSVSDIGAESNNTGSLFSSSIGQMKAVETDRKYDGSTDLGKQFRKSVGIVDQRRRPEQRKTTRQWDAICSAIDLRIAEVVQGHLASASLTAGDPVGPVRSHSLAALWPPAAGKPDAAPTRESETQTKDDGGGPTEAGIAPPQRPSVSQGEVHNELRSDTRDKICALVNDVTIRSPTKVMKATDCSPNVAETTPDIPPNDYESLSDDAGTNNCPSTGPVHLTSQPDQVSLAHGPREPPERPPPSTRNDGDRVTRGNTWHSTPASPNVSSTQPHRQACPAASVRKPEPPQPQNIFPDIPARNVTPNGNSDSPPIMDLGINLSHVLHDGHIDACKPTSVLETVNHFKDGRKDSVAMTTLFDREVNLSGTHRRASSGSVDVFAKSLGDIPEHLANESSKLKTERKSENWRITKSNQKRSKNSAQTCVVNMNYHNNPAIAKGLNDHSIIASCVQNNTIDQKLGNTIITESQVSSIMTKNETPVIATSPGDPSGNTCADGAVSNSNMSTHGNTKQRNHTTTHRTGKSKRFRRSNATVRPNPSSSSDSTVPSSSDEDDEMLSRVNRSRLESTPLKSSNSRIIQTGRDNRAPSTLRSKGIFPVETLSSQAQGINEGTARECCPKRHLSQPQQPQSNQNKERTTPYLIVGQSDCPVTPQESRMHFASSDINPFVHQWQEEQLLHKGYKIPVFGSAADLSSKSPPLNGTERHMTRCCSVDNGLNGQNSPFNSHLSTFVNHKGLSSTLSSGEDYKEQGRTTSRDVSDASCPRSSSIDNGLASLSLNSGSSCHDVPRGLGADSSVRVDEIMLLYSPEQGSSLANTAQTQRCRTFEEHGTQTGYQVMKNLVAGPQGSCASIAPGREHSRTNRHQRSRTHVPTSLRTKEDITQCPTWASMENMSVHLSQLIHSTSDLLGDVQGMRTGETLVNPSPRRIGSNVTTPRCTLKDSTRTQSSFDIGIQTEANSMSSVKEIPHQWTSPPERSEPHEVNVIVKVIGSDSLRVSFEKGFSGVVVESPRSDDRERSKSDLRSNTLAATESTELHLLKTFHSLTSAGKPTETKMCSTTSSPSSNSKQSVADTQSGFSQTSHRLSRTTASVKTGRPPCSVEQTRYTDRASSPIVTLGTNERPNGSHYSPCQGKQKRGLLVRDQDATHRICGDVSSHKSGELASLESVSQMSLTESSFTSKGLRSHVVRNVEQENSRDEENNNPCSINRDSAKSPHQTTLTTRNGISRRSHPSGGGCHGDGCSPEDVVRHDDRDTRTAPTTERPHGPLKCGGISTSSSLGGARTPEDDALSTAPSESSTDVLLNTNPVAGRAPPPPPAQQHHPRGRLLPEDLPMHNKFSHWSGISETQRRSSTRRPNRPDSLSTDGQPPGSGDPSGGVGMEGAAEEGQASIVGATLGGLRGRKTREIERLRWEREQVMASVRGEVSAPRLTVELAEARLHYGLGETDALLRMLSPAGRDEAEPAGARPTDQEPAGASPTNQELCDRHRRSADWSRQEREARLQSSRRARSLSPSRHPAYLQLLRQEVMDSTREPSTGREEGRYPSEIQHLLRDYGRAREEACGEIARARERLRHRTELEKRRLQQQAAAAAAAAIKDDASRFRAGTSSSTLCTDSSLSLSSGHTSGYVSGHTPQRQTPGGAPPRAQDLRFDDEGSKVRVRPPPCGSQGSKGPRRWLSTQDFQLVSPASEFKPLLTSSPAAVPTRQRSSSFGSASSSSSTYQNMASGLLSQALLEIRLAAAGDTANLLLGKASAGWRHEGEEQGIQAYYRPFCSPTAHGFLGAGELDGPLADLWDLLQQPSNCRLYNSAVRLAWTRPLDGSTQLVYVLTNPSVCNLSQPRDFCCLSVASKQGGGVRVLAQQSVFEESLPWPSVEAVRGEMMPSAWCLQPITRGGLEVVRVVYLLQVDLGSPALPSSQLGAAARRHASVVAELGSLLRAARPPKRGCSLP